MARRPAQNLRRRPARSEPKKLFIIFCEGKNTEPAYLKALRQSFSKALIKVEIVGGVGVLHTVAKSAADRAKRKKRKLDSYEENDEIWAVFDRDEHPNYSEAIQICQSARVGVAYSDPCFELWLILHIENYDRSDDRHQIQAHLHSLRPEYNPRGRKMVNCGDLIGNIDQAEEKAANQINLRADEGNPCGRPSTTMFRLTRAIRDAVAKVR